MALNKENNFLQSDFWRKFQEAVGHKTFLVENEPAHNASHNEAGRSFSASIVEHQLPVVGKYFYVPRGPKIEILNPKSQIPNKFKIQNSKFKISFSELIDLAKKNQAGWIRIEPENNQALELIKNNISLSIKKAPHDMQPREVFVVDITKSEEELLAGMKSKTRYNINLAQKRGVSINVIPAKTGIQGIDFLDSGSEAGMTKNYVDKFVELVSLTAKRKSVNFHPESYYRKMLEIIPSDILKLYVAEYENKVIAANLVIFFGDTVTYLHGATDDEYRNVMAPYLLQWQAIKDAKEAGYERYDFGGVKTQNIEHKAWNKNDWSGITKFKLGFVPNTEPVKFPGSFDLVIDAKKYFICRLFNQLKKIVKIGIL